MYLHETLLTLSGHPSPLLVKDAVHDFPLMSKAEDALLSSVGELARLHRDLKAHLKLITEEHPSLICRAVANDTSLLRRFQDAILDVERSILSRDATAVGGYNIVPLSSVVSRLAEWKRCLEWHWQLACYMLPPNSSSRVGNIIPSKACNGAQIIDRLRRDVFTGYSDIERASNELAIVAENAWLRQLSAWIMTDGFTIHHVATVGNADFFVHQGHLKKDCMPAFLSRQTAEKTLYVGRTLAYVDGTTSNDTESSSKGDVHSRVSHIKHLQSVVPPISSHNLTSAVDSIRSSVNHQLVHGMLPIHKLTDTIQLMRQFCLGGRIDFVDALIAEAEKHLRSKQSRNRATAAKGTSRQLAGITMRTSEVAKVLDSVWSAMAANLSMAETVDGEVEWAREHVSLAIVSTISEDGSPSQQPQHEVVRDLYSNFLLPVSTVLRIQLKAPLDLFLGTSELSMYRAISSYLLAVRRSHAHLNDLWRQRNLRKGAAFSASSSTYKYRMHTSRKLRERATQREARMRTTWAVSSSAAYFLAELGEYLNGEIKSSWTHFELWLHGESAQDEQNLSEEPHDHAEGNPSSVPRAEHLDTESATHQRSTTKAPTHEPQSDPEVVAEGHRQYLFALLGLLLLTQGQYTEALHSLLIRVDQMVGLVLRVRSVQSNLDLHDEGVDDGFAEKYAKEEREILVELNGAEKRLKQSLASVVTQLTAVQQQDHSIHDVQSSGLQTGFDPILSSGIDRLLVRLDVEALTSPG